MSAGTGGRPERESRWEALRILAMLCIIFCHFIGQSGFLIWGKADQVRLAMLFGTGDRIAVNLFLLLGVWFMTDARITGERILRFAVQVWTYAAGATAVVWALGYSVPALDVAKGFLPLTTRAVWFASGYFALLLLAPFLQRALEWERRRLGALVGVTFVLGCAWLTAGAVYTMEDGWFDIVGWFAWVFLAMGYYKRHWAERLKINRWVALGAGLGGYFLLEGAQLLLAPMADRADSPAGMAVGVVSRFLHDYKTFPNLFCAASIFYFFQHVDLGRRRWVNVAAEGAFAAYLLHQTPAVMRVIWRFGFHCNHWIREPYAFWAALGVPVAVYAVAWALEAARRRTLERWITGTRAFRRTAGWLDRWLGDGFVNSK